MANEIYSKMKGIFTALLTPFNRDESINYDALAELTEFNIKKGVHGFYVGGSTGEGMVMADTERMSVFDKVASTVNGRVSLIAHVGSIRTNSAIEMGKCAKECGFDAISAVAPFYYGFKLDEILGYYKDIVAAVDMPMIIYNFPPAGGFSLTPAVAKELFEDERFVGIKHTSSDLFTLEQFKKIRKNVAVFNGYDEMLLGGLAMGADGGIGSTYNFMADKYVKMYNLFNEGEIFAAQAVQQEINAIIKVLIKCGVFQSEKYILSRLGINMGDCRKPFKPLQENYRAELDEIVKTL